MKQRLKKIKPVNLIRRVTQLIAFILLPGLFVSAFLGIKDIYLAIIGGTLSTTALTSQILLLAATILTSVVLGRFFCGFFCSFGAMGDLLWFLSKKTIKPKFTMNEKVDAVLKYLKYGVLAFLVLGVWTFGLISIGSMSSPWDVFGIYSSLSGWTSPQYLLSIGGLLLVLIIIGSLFVERFFCRYLCPLGAIFAITSKARLFNIKKNREKCGSCRMCTSKCSMGIPLYQYDKVTSGECINCFACIDVCPRKNAQINPTPAIASATSVAAISSLLYMGNIASVTASDLDTSITGTAVSQTTQGQYTDGTYTGSAPGFRGETTVSVTVENGYITDITVVSTDDDYKYFSKAENSVINDILESQDTDVDAVSGATFSSVAIMDAVADALTLMDSANANTEDSSTTTDNNTENSLDNSNTDTETSASDAQTYADGTYTGTGTGFRGDTEVSVTVSNGIITDITVTSYQDDERYFVAAESTVIDEILDSQDVNVDAVSGATFSSNGIMEAVANALGVDYTNTNDTNSRGGHGFGHR